MKYSSSVLGAALGVVALAVVAAFGIFLPKAESGAGSETTSSLPRLPQKVGNLVALDSGALPAALQQQIGAVTAVNQVQREAVQGLRKVYGEPSVYRFYASTDAQSLAAVTVIARDPGLFSPDGPPVTATSGQQPTYQLAKVGGAVCAEYYGQQTGATGQPSGAVQLTRAHCQLGADGRTYDIDARGLSVARTVAALKQIAGA